MADSVPIQTSFAAGELDPKFMGLVGTDLHKKALLFDENFEPFAYGSILMRGGSRFAALYPDLDSTARVIDFPRQGDVGFLVLLGDGKLRVLDGATGSAVPATSIDHLLNPRFTYGWQYWRRHWSIVAAPTENPEAAAIVNGRYLLTQGGLLTFPAIDQTTAPLAAGTYTLRFTYATAGGNAIALIATSGATLLNVRPAPTGGLATLKTVEYSVTLAAPGAVTVTVQQDPLADYETINEVRYCTELKELSLRSTGGGTAVWDGTTTPAMPWSNEQLEALQVVAEPARDRLMFFHGRVAPHELLFDSVTGAWAFRPASFIHVAPAPWGAGDFQGAYPAVAELYQGRLMVGGIPGKENTILASKSGEPFNFTEATAASNADYFSLDVSTKGAWRWMQGHRTLLMGTDKGEHILTAQGGVLTPSDFEVRAQSGFGSAPVQAITLGELVLYVSRDRRRLRMLSYNQQENGWQTRDLTFASEHLTGGQVREVRWISTGNDKVVGVMRSGEIVAWTFHKAEGTIAPWRVSFGGPVHSMAVVDCGDSDRVWMLVGRVGGVALEEWHVADDPNRILVDSWVSGAPVAGVFSGLDHLEGSTVVPIVDGVVQASQVVAGGAITVPLAAGQVVAGLFGSRKFTTLRHEGGNAEGTTAGAKQRPVKLSLRLNDSALPLVNGVRCGADRTPATPMDTVEGRQSGDFKVRVLGWEDGASVTVSQDVPIRTEVLAIYAVVATREV